MYKEGVPPFFSPKSNTRIADIRRGYAVTLAQSDIYFAVRVLLFGNDKGKQNI